MTRTLITLTLACLVALAPIGVRAADPPSDDSDVTTHEQLRELRTGLFNAFNKNDVDTLLTYCHPDIVVVWQDGSISEGHKGVAVKFKELDAFLDSMNCKPASDHLSVIYDGDGGGPRGAAAVFGGRRRGRGLLSNGARGAPRFER